MLSLMISCCSHARQRLSRELVWLRVVRSKIVLLRQIFHVIDVSAMLSKSFS